MVVIGASNPSPAEVAALLQADARVQVYATEPGPAVQDLADRVRLQLSRLSPTAFTADGALLARILDGVALVITDGGTEADRAVLAAAEKVGVVAVRLTPGGQESGGQESGGHEPGQDGPDRVGRVVLVGGGPGDPGLLTIAGMEAIRSADVIATDRLAPLAALANARVDAEIIDVGKIPAGRASVSRPSRSCWSIAPGAARRWSGSRAATASSSAAAGRSGRPVRPPASR
ncbi:hypothetical protein GCM10027613_15470 [Microlunatus endophyticus]